MLDELPEQGAAVLTYDKRGVGQSGGECCPGDRGDFDLLAADAHAAVDALRRHPEVDSARVGLIGFSQGGWVVPITAQRSPDVAFAVIVSGTAVSVGHELLHEKLVEEGADPSEIERRLKEAEPSIFDPTPFLVRMRPPTLWAYGTEDTVQPVDASIAAVERLIEEESKQNFKLAVFPGRGHEVHDPELVPTIIRWLRGRAGIRVR